MPGKSIGTIMNLGYEGYISRNIPQPSIEAKPVASDSIAIKFGRPVVLNDDNTVSDPSSVALTTANFAGIAVVTTQQNNTYPPDNAAGSYAADNMADILQSGYATVKVGRGTPTAGGGVYVRVAESTEHPDAQIGDFEAQSDGTQTVLLPNATWASGIVDANSIAEVKLKYPNN